MATTTPSLRSVHHRNPIHHHHHHPTFLSRRVLSLNSSSFSFSLTTAFSASTSATAATDTSLDALARHLSSQDLRQADEETRRLLIAFAGDAAVKRGYVFFSEVKFIAPSDLWAVDRLWRAHSGGRLGYSVQKRIWEGKAVERDFTQFFIRVGWMRKLDTEVEQWNYRSFPTEFVWEFKDDAPPEGHLPLTNALRGTQLLAAILTHPAFQGSGEDGDPTAAEGSGSSSPEQEGGKERPGLLGGKIKLKPADYSF